MRDTRRIVEVLAAAAVLLFFILTAPRTPWESDEMLFASAVQHVDLALNHPHAPGYPLFILLGKLVHLVVENPWRALLIVNILAAAIGFFLLTRLLRRLLGDIDLALCGAFLFTLSASMVVNAPLALSDGVSLMFLIGAFAALAAEQEVLAAVLASAAIGCRPQLVIPLLPAMLIAFVRMRRRVAAVAAFAVASLVWFLPLVYAAGGFAELIAYEQRQASYAAVHDAAMSRGALSAGAIAVRFLLHPWGAKFITLPLIVLVLLGAIAAWRKRSFALLPLAVFTLAQILFELARMDPADAARYALPSMIFFALLAAFGLGLLRDVTHLRVVPPLVTLVLVVLSVGYVRTILQDRTSLPSPPAAAAAWGTAHLPPNTVVLFDASMRPAAEFLLSQFRSMPIEEGLRAFYDRPSVPLVVYADGGSEMADARVFAWHASDAYGKLTRNHYLRVTLDPIDASERYLPLSGVYALERTVTGEEWRWLARTASLRLPQRHSANVELRFRLSADAPYDDGTAIDVNGREAARVVVRKGAVTSAIVPVGGGTLLTIRSDHSFQPAAVLHNRDPRELAVQLVSVRQR